MNNLEKVYQHHHTLHHRQGVSVMKDERTDLWCQAIGTGRRVLDLGCRDGTLTSCFVMDNEVLGVDIDQAALVIAAQNLPLKTLFMDLNSDWPELGNSKFDVVVAGEVLEHLYFPDQVIRKVLNHLNKNGIFLGSVPNAFSLRHRLRYLFGQKLYTPLNDPTHINQFSYQELQQLLASCFQQVDIIGLGRFKWLARHWPSWFAFDLVWIASSPKI